MARRVILYTPPPAGVREGRKSVRVVELMGSGFRRWEARELALLPRDDPALVVMTKQRRGMASRVLRQGSREGLSRGQAQYRLSKTILGFYEKRVLVKTVKRDPRTLKIVSTDKRGYPHQWRRKLIDISQRSRKKHKFAGVEIPPEELDETPGRKGRGRRDIQRKKRKLAVRVAKAQAEQKQGVPVERLKRWLRDSERWGRTQRGEQKELAGGWQDRLRRRIEHAEAEEALGRPAVG